jgi:hypothetical protein
VTVGLVLGLGGGDVIALEGTMSIWTRGRSASDCV